MCAGAEGARRGNVLGMVLGLTGGILGELCHGVEILGAVFDREKTVREANQEYLSDFNEVIEKLRSKGS